MKTMRKILEIDEERCNGCGLCVLDCAEGAIAIVDGKAKIVSDSFCDGLGACIGSCPQDALHIIEREAVPFDEEAAMEHVRSQGGTPEANHGHGHGAGTPHRHRQSAEHGGHGRIPGHGGCPGAAMRRFDSAESPAFAVAEGTVKGPGHWPLKIRLVPPTAPFLKGADVLVAADCAAAASPIFHSHFAAGKVVLIGCPKFDDTEAYAERLADILRVSGIASLTVLRMEVPCCRGLSAAAEKARVLSGTSLVLKEVIMTCAGGPAAPAPLSSL